MRKSSTDHLGNLPLGLHLAQENFVRQVDELDQQLGAACLIQALLLYRCDLDLDVFEPCFPSE